MEKPKEQYSKNELVESARPSAIALSTDSAFIESESQAKPPSLLTFVSASQDRGYRPSSTESHGTVACALLCPS